MSEFPISTLAAVIETLPVPVVLTTTDGVVVAASRASQPFLGAIDPGESLHDLLERLRPSPATTSHHVKTEGDRHVIVTIDGAATPAPADVAALARSTAHDFNNLLGVIINFASLAAAQLPEGSNAAQDLQEVLVASRRAATLTNRLLQIAAAAPDQHEQ